MKLFYKSVFAIIFAGMTFSHAQLNINPNVVTFRSPATAANTTTHYGDLNLNGGNSGMGWGWLIANQVQCAGTGFFGGSVSINNGLWVSGDLTVAGVKNFIDPHPTDTTLAIKYVSIESDEALTLARGVGVTLNGSATIVLPEAFGLVTSLSAPLSVLITPEGAPSLIFVKTKTTKNVTVEIKGVDFREYGDLNFSYQVTGVRNGYENVNPIVKLDSALSLTSNMPKTDVDPVGKKREEFRERIRTHIKNFHK